MSKRATTAPFRVEYCDNGKWRIEAFEMNERLARKAMRQLIAVSWRGLTAETVRYVDNPQYIPPQPLRLKVG